MERIAVVDGLTLAAVLDRIAGGGRVVLTHGGDDVAVVVRPDDLSDAATAYLLEAFERVDLSDLLAKLDAPHPVTPNGRPQSPPAGVS
jgi:antitoxin (DNA-binding transcriptional repressor) of toxin-antitoxin stability system